MHFSSISSLLFLAAAGLFAHAKPIENGLAVREEPGANIMARHYPENPCSRHTALAEACHHH
jgi:hypothetical protein